MSTATTPFPEKKLSTLLAIMGEMCKVLKMENTFLKKQSQEKCQNILEQKAKISTAYEQAFSYFEENKTILASLPDKQKSMFRKAAVTLSDLSTENARLLKINMEASSRLLGAIIQDVKEQNKSTNLYTKQGEMRLEKGNPSALTFNQVL